MLARGGDFRICSVWQGQGNTVIINNSELKKGRGILADARPMVKDARQPIREVRYVGTAGDIKNRDLRRNVVN